MSTGSPKLVHEVSDEFMQKVDSVIDFINENRNRIDTQFKRWFTPREAAAHIGVSHSQLVQHLTEKIPPIKDGKKVVYDREDLDRYWIERKEANRLTQKQLETAQKINR